MDTFSRQIALLQKHSIEFVISADGDDLYAVDVTQEQIGDATCGRTGDVCLTEWSIHDIELWLGERY